jgi:Ca-activated chloride channel homolog
MLSFQWPWMGGLIVLPWLVLILSSRFNNNSNNEETDSVPLLQFPYLSRIESVFSGRGNQVNSKTPWQKVIFYLAWLCLVLTSMRPVWVNDVAFAKNFGYDLMLAVDLSRSMDANDFSYQGKYISRVDATKKVVSRFVQQRDGDRVGLIVFAEQAYLTVPLTLDLHAVSKMLNHLLVGMAGDSTSIGDAIGVAVKSFRKRNSNAKILILLTDGEDTSSRLPPLEAAKLAKENNIKIYTIGVGGDAGNMVANVPFDEKILQEIASSTDGIYSRASSIDSLEKIYQQIDQLEKSQQNKQALLITDSLHTVPLGLSLLCGLLLVGVKLRRINYGN